MWMVCDTCGKKVCDDKNLYRHRNDTPKSQCKKCIKCDVPITSRRQIRTHMKLNHRDIPCSDCNKKFYLEAARDQHWRDVHSGKEPQEQTSVFNTPSDQPKGYGGSGGYDYPNVTSGHYKGMWGYGGRGGYGYPNVTSGHHQGYRGRGGYGYPDVTSGHYKGYRGRGGYNIPNVTSGHFKGYAGSGDYNIPFVTSDQSNGIVDTNHTDKETVLFDPDETSSDCSTPSELDEDPDETSSDCSTPSELDEDPDETSSDCSTPSELDEDSDTSTANEKCQQPEHNTRFLTSFRECGNNLKRLLDEKVRQDPDTMRRYKATVHELVQFMQHNCGVSEVVKGGSLGKGTSIKEKADIDLIVFMKNITSVADLQEKHKDIIKDLKKHILKDFNFAKQVHYSYDTKHSNRFGIRIDGGKGLIQVDQLPACDIGGGSERVFDEMAGKDKEARSFYSVSFAKDQVKFTREKPEPVKDAIRLVKDWKMLEKLNIPSYTVEIVTSKEWERMGRPDKPDLDQLFKRTMTQFSHMDNINITWPNDRAEYSRQSDQTRGPIVMDPANPFNNTASLIRRSDQGVIEKKAREVVRWL